MTIKYTPTAEAHLKQLEQTAGDDLWDAVVDAVELIVNSPSKARQNSEAISAEKGVVYYLPFVGFKPYKVFWSSEEPRIEGIFPY